MSLRISRRRVWAALAVVAAATVALVVYSGVAQGSGETNHERRLSLIQEVAVSAGLTAPPLPLD
jgi:hypothetical protein